MSQSAGLKGHRRPRGYWRDLDTVIAEVKAFMLEAESTRLQEASRLITGSHLDPRPTGPISRPSLFVESGDRIDDEHLGSIHQASVGDGSQGGDPSGGLSPSTIDTSSDFLPTQRELIKAGRRDLLYAIQMHGHERVASGAGLRVEKRGLKKGALTVDLIRGALKTIRVAGLMTEESNVGAVRALDIQRHLEESLGIKVTLGHINRLLSRLSDEGRLVRKVARGVFILREHDALS